MTVGMRNNGPALIFDRSGGEGVDTLLVTFPKGATATKIPSGCSLINHGIKGTGPYQCGAPDAYIQPPGYQANWTFTARADATLANARGTAQLSNQMHDMNGSPVTFPWDNSTTGYTQAIVFNGPATAATPSSPATQTSGALATTGGGRAMPLLAGIGAAVIALGAGVFVLARRRRTAPHA